RISVMAGEADRVAGRDRLERALFQPEVIADIFRRLDDIFFARLALRLISFVANGTALWRRRLLLLKQHTHKQAAIAVAKIRANHIDVFVVREPDTELRNQFAALQFWISEIAKTGEQPARRVFRSDREVAVRTDR